MKGHILCSLFTPIKIQLVSYIRKKVKSDNNHHPGGIWNQNTSVDKLAVILGNNSYSMVPILFTYHRMSAATTPLPYVVAYMGTFLRTHCKFEYVNPNPTQAGKREKQIEPYDYEQATMQNCFSSI